MPKRSSKRKDTNETAFAIVQQTTGETPPPDPVDPIKEAARALGRRGGLKGGKARAKRLTSTQLTAAARKAARARWKTKRKD